MRIPLATLAAWASIPLSAFALMAGGPSDVPLSRLEANVRNYLSEHPDDGQAHYVLGRLYAIAYATRSETLGVASEGSSRELPVTEIGDSGGKDFMRPVNQDSRDEVRWHSDLSAMKLTAEDEQRVKSLIVRLDSDTCDVREKSQADLSAMGLRVIPTLKETIATGKLSSEQEARIRGIIETLEKGRNSVWALNKAIAEYQAAVEKSKDPALALLGLGWCWEEAGQTDKAIDAYCKACAAAAQADLDREKWPRYCGSWHGSVTLEAGTRLLALLPKDDPHREDISKTVEVLQVKVDKGPTYISPVVVPLRGERELRDLLDPARVVPFDLVGDGRTRWWPWVRPTTGILVWDPRGRASIRRGQQLFGSITWHIPFRHGYEPLAWLDDDGDGRLEGNELRGLAIWRDADQDGVSSPEEVMPLSACGVRSLGFDASFSDDGPWCARGVEFTDGRVAPTYDWLPRSVPLK